MDDGLDWIEWTLSSVGSPDCPEVVFVDHESSGRLLVG